MATSRGALAHAPAYRPEYPAPKAPEPVRPTRPAGPVPAARPRKSVSRVMTSLVLGCSVVFGLVLLNIYLAQTSFNLSDVQARVAEEQSRQRALRSEVAGLQSPERVARMAEELGLVVPAQSVQLD